MQRRFLKFIFWTISIGTVIIFALSGCSFYDKIDNKIHPTPEIHDKVDYQLNKYANGRLDVTFAVSVTDGDLAMFYYSCKTEDGWDADREVGAEPIENGMAESAHVTKCETMLLIQVIAYNNYQKRSQKQSGKAWVINLNNSDIL